MKVGETYSKKEHEETVCTIVKLVEHLVHKYFVHVKVSNRYFIYTQKEFQQLWTKNVLDETDQTQ
jgi:hypothetical protein